MELLTSGSNLEIPVVILPVNKASNIKLLKPVSETQTMNLKKCNPGTKTGCLIPGRFLVKA
jgi:hypothetical protein